MIEKLDNANSITLDFIQENINKKIFNKINEIIDYINHGKMCENSSNKDEEKETEGNLFIKSSYETLQDKIKRLSEENYAKDTEINKLKKINDLMASSILNYDDQLVINHYRDKEHVKETFTEYAMKEDK